MAVDAGFIKVYSIVERIRDKILTDRIKEHGQKEIFLLPVVLAGI